LEIVVNMKSPAVITIALGSCVAGALIAAIVLAFILPVESNDLAHSAHHRQASAVRSNTSNGSKSSFYSEIRDVNAHMHASMEIAPRGDVDQNFVRMMIPHHQGAVDMALVLLKYGRDERLRRLAQSIIVEQGQEITYMRTLLDSPSAQASTTHHIADQ
jgi:uncharacterized protein (DUF305 family)